MLYYYMSGENFVTTNLNYDELQEFINSESKSDKDLEAKIRATSALRQVSENKKAQDAEMLKMLSDNVNMNEQKRKEINKSRANKQRLVEINTYYNKKYTMQINIIKYIIKISLIILALGYFKKISVIPGNIVIAAIIIVLIWGSIGVIYKLYDFYSRNNMYFDEYDFLLRGEGSTSGQMGIWEYNKKHLFNPLKQSVSNSAVDILDIATCVGDSCCDGNTVWDSDIQKCTTVKTASKVENPIGTPGTGDAAGAQ